MYISDTSIPGRVLQLSSEHHVRNEIVLKNAANWELYALQTEGETGESANAYSLDIDGCRNLTIANYHGCRVVKSYQPFPYAVRISHSSDIRFRNFHVDNNSAIPFCNSQREGCRQLVRAGKVSYADAIVNETAHTRVRDGEFAWLGIIRKTRRSGALHTLPVVEPGAKIEKVASGFVNLSGGTADASGNLIVVSNGGMRETVYAFRPGAGRRDIDFRASSCTEPPRRKGADCC